MKKSLNEIILAIVLENGTKTSKVNRIIAETGLSKKNAEKAYEGLAFVHKLNDAQGEALRIIRSFTMGVEIECFNINRSTVASDLASRGIRSITTGYNHTDYTDTYKLGSDCSIQGNDSCEVVTPILKNLEGLKTLCEVLNANHAQVNKSCGLHVHFGAAKLSADVIKRIFINYARAERAIDSFMPNSRRAENNHYCDSIKRTAERMASLNFSSIEDLVRYQGGRYFKVNLQSYRNHKTIEFRQHNGTTDFAKIESWIKFLNALIVYSQQHKEVISETSRLEDIPWLTGSLKAFYTSRRAALE